MKKSSRYKVLTIISGDLWAGAETMAYHLLKRLREYDDLDLTAIVLNQRRLFEEIEGLGITAHVVDENRYRFWQIMAKCRQIIGSSRTDIIHSHRYKENLLALLLRGGRSKLISTLHGLPECHEGGKARIVLRAKTACNFRILSRFFTTVAVSQEMREFLTTRCGFSSDKVASIHNGIDLADISAQPADDRRTFVIGSAGRLCPVKDFTLMVEIARSIAATGEEVRFELAGDGPELAKLKRLVAGYGLKGSFIFRGHQEDMAGFYRGLDVYLCTSQHEGIPMTILEALAHGLPVVAAAVGGIGEIVDDGKEGFLLQGRQPDRFAATCLLLKKNGEERRRMGRAAREKAERAFSAETMAESYHELYRRIVNGP